MSRVTGPSSAWRVLRTRSFGPYFVGNAASASGTWFQNLAASVYVYELTHSALLLGVLNACQFGPVLVLAPWAGRIADAFDRRRLLLWTQAVAALLAAALAALVWAGEATTWLVIVFATGFGVLTAVATPAQMALVGSLVPREDLPQAVALNSMTFNLARAVGPAGGALVIATLGLTWAFALNAASYLTLVTALLLIRPLEVQSRPTGRPRLRESFALVRRDRNLALPLLVVGAIAVSVDPVATLGPAYAEQLLHRPDSWAGYLMAAFGIGAVSTALVVGGREIENWNALVARLFLLFAGLVAFGLAPTSPIALAALVATGAGFLTSNAGATTYVLVRAAEAHRGRIMALWAVMFVGLRPLASLACGSLASVAGVRVATLVMALPSLAAAIAVSVLARRG